MENKKVIRKRKVAKIKKPRNYSGPVDEEEEAKVEAFNAELSDISDIGGKVHLTEAN